ncbi:MAG: DNA primase [Acidiferrobacteraceae bacterium]
MSADALLSRLEGVRQTAPGRWQAACPAHPDRSPSLSVRELPDGRLLVHDFSGCSTSDVLAAVGLSMADLFPERLGEHFKSERHPFPAVDILNALALESFVILAAGAQVLGAQPFSDLDQARLAQAVDRIQSALSAGGIHA